MKVDAEIVSAPEAAYLLRSLLGPIRSWSDFLADAIRDKAYIDEMTLKPCCCRHDGRMYRPHYSIADVQKFVRAVKSVRAEAHASKVKTVRQQIDGSVGWRYQKFDKDGKSVRIH